MSEAQDRLRDAGERVARGEAWAKESSLEEARGALREASRAWDALVDRASELRVALEEDSSEEREDALARAWLDAVTARDEAELTRLGAEFYGATDEDLDPEGAAALRAFDELLRPSLWKLLAARAENDERNTPWERVSERHRARFWWHFEAREVPPHALEALPAVALLLARFPEAEASLRGLLRARGAWVEARRAKEPPVAAVTTLASWVARRRGVTSDFALAAADTVLAEQTVFAGERFECSLRGARVLLVDVLTERDEARAPTVEPAGAPERARVGTEVRGAVERFEFVLTDEELGAPGGVCVRVRARDGSESVARLPADAER